MAYPESVMILQLQILKFEVRTFCRGQLGLNVYWYQVEAGSPPEDAYQALDQWIQDRGSDYAALLTDQALMVDGTLRVYDSTVRNRPLTPTLFSAKQNVQGTAGAEPCPTQVCGLITRRVNTIGKDNRGRLYIPFPDLAFVSNMEPPTAAYIAKLDTLRANALPLNAPYSSFGGNSWDPGLYHSKNTFLFSPLIDTASQKKWATHRSRGDYGTPNVSPQ